MAERSRSRTCESCKARSPTGEWIGELQFFECRRRAPNADTPKDLRQKRVIWPRVRADEWCMEYSAA